MGVKNEADLVGLIPMQSVSKGWMESPREPQHNRESSTGAQPRGGTAPPAAGAGGDAAAAMGIMKGCSSAPSASLLHY